VTLLHNASLLELFSYKTSIKKNVDKLCIDTNQLSKSFYARNFRSLSYPNHNVEIILLEREE